MAMDYIEDANGIVIWIKGWTKISPLTYREAMMALEQTTGSVVKDGVTYIPPFRRVTIGG